MSIKIDKTQAIEIFRGDSYAQTWAFTDPTTGLPINLTDVVCVLTINSLENPPDDTTQIEQITGSVGDATGKITFILPSLDFPDEYVETTIKYYYDIQFTGLTWGPKTLFKSTYTLTEDINKD